MKKQRDVKNYTGKELVCGGIALIILSIIFLLKKQTFSSMLFGSGITMIMWGYFEW